MTVGAWRNEWNPSRFDSFQRKFHSFEARFEGNMWTNHKVWLLHMVALSLSRALCVSSWFTLCDRYYDDDDDVINYPRETDARDTEAFSHDVRAPETEWSKSARGAFSPRPNVPHRRFGCSWFHHDNSISEIWLNLKKKNGIIPQSPTQLVHFEANESMSWLRLWLLGNGHVIQLSIYPKKSYVLINVTA